jgi:endonuclease/exonuclease/phosphatase (EEP) superfamily protein YafD
MDLTWITFFIRIVLYSLGTLALLLTILPLFNFSHWVFRIGDFPRLQIAVVCLVMLATIPMLEDWNAYTAGVETVFLICLVYQMIRIFPYTKLKRKQVERSSDGPPESKISILISNVLINNRNSEKLLDRISDCDPDVILLAEVDDWWDQAVSVLKKEYPNHICHPLDNAYGLNFYTRLETENCQLNFIVEDDIPSIETDLIMPSGETIKFYGLHPRPPVPSESPRSTERDAELLIVGKRIKAGKLPTIIAGDFNDVAWSKTTNLFQKISGLLDARIGRGFYNSFHADLFFLRMPLDHVFQSKHFRLVELKRLIPIGSDHFPIYIELRLEKTAEKTQDEPQSNGDDRKEADEKIKEADE